MKILLVFILSFSFFIGDTPTAPPINSNAIAFELKNINGKTVSLENFKDSNGVILFF